MITAAIVSFAILLAAWLVAPAGASASRDSVSMGSEEASADAA